MDIVGLVATPGDVFILNVSPCFTCVGIPI